MRRTIEHAAIIAAEDNDRTRLPCSRQKPDQIQPVWTVHLQIADGDIDTAAIGQ
jgi:hypothetical protein